MTEPYIDPDTVAIIGTGDVVPSSWFNTIRDALETLARPPGCVVKTTGTQELTSHEWTTIEFNDTDLRDTDAYHPSGSGTITVPAGLGGWYDAGMVHQFASAATGTRAIRALVNGGTAFPLQQPGAAMGTAIPELSGQRPIRLFAGDEVEFQAFQNTGDPIDSVGCQAWLWLRAWP